MQAKRKRTWANAGTQPGDKGGRKRTPKGLAQGGNYFRHLHATQKSTDHDAIWAFEYLRRSTWANFDSSKSNRATSNSEKLFYSGPQRETYFLAVYGNGNRQNTQAERHRISNNRVDEKNSVRTKEGRITPILCQLLEVKCGNWPRLISPTS